MTDISNYKKSLEKDKIQIQQFEQASNPLALTKQISLDSISEYNQELARSKYDSDINEIVEIVRILNNMAPIKMPVYNFNLDEINGERYYKPDGNLLLVREYDSDVIRDYYAALECSDPNYSVSRILEHDKITGRLRTKIEPVTRVGNRIKFNIAIFDEKINNKYILMQLSEDGVVNNITEFTGKGKSFQALFRDVYTYKPVRYLEGKDDKEKGFEMRDCIFDSNGSVVRIKKYSNKKEVTINYSDMTKNINVKTKRS